MGELHAMNSTVERDREEFGRQYSEVVIISLPQGLLGVKCLQLLFLISGCRASTPH